MKLYHISGYIDNLKEKKFIPRIPKCKMDFENKSIKRICFSDSILGCLKSLPEYGNGVGSKSNMKLKLGIPIFFDVYTIDSEDVNKIYSPEFLFKNNYVKDSLKTKEYWVLSEVTAKKEFRIEIIDIYFNSKDEEIIRYTKRLI